MKFYAQYLQSKNIEVVYIDAFNELSDVRKLIPYLKTKGVDSFEYIDTTDNWLEHRIIHSAQSQHMEPVKNPTPMFLNSSAEIAAFFSSADDGHRCNFLGAGMFL